MDHRTGDIYRFKNDNARKIVEKNLGRKLVLLTEKQAKKLKPLSNRRRKALLAGMHSARAEVENHLKSAVGKNTNETRNRKNADTTKDRSWPGS